LTEPLRFELLLGLEYELLLLLEELEYELPRLLDEPK
jgi:hypothetical protein